MNNFKKSVCSVSIAIALSASANSFAQESVHQQELSAFVTSEEIENNVQASFSGQSTAVITQGKYTGVSQSNDSSIDMVGKNNTAYIVVEGTDNVSTIEQINTENTYGSYAKAYTASKTDAGAANNTNNTNSITQYGGINYASSMIGVGSNNTVSVNQDGKHKDGIYVNASKVNVNGDANSVDINQVGLTDTAETVVYFDITGDDNTATIDIKSDGALLGWGHFAAGSSYFIGNGNTLVADIYDAGFSDTVVEMTGDNNSVTISTTGDSSNGKAKNINIKEMVGSDNTFVIDSHGDGGYHNLSNITGDDNQITITDNGGYNNKTLMTTWTGSGNIIDITVEGNLLGGNQVNLSKTDGDNSVTTVNMTGDSNKIKRLDGDGNNNIWDLTVSGTDNNMFASAVDSRSSPGFTPTTGDDNTMIINQDGENNFAAYLDHGDRRYYETVQIGDNNSSLVRGIGDDKKISVLQIGSGNNSELKIDRIQGSAGQLPGGHKSAIITQTGAYNLIMLDAKASATIEIEQTGAYNSVDLTATALSEEFGVVALQVDIEQDGMGNIYEGEIRSGKWSHQFVNQIGDDNFIHWEEGGGFQNKGYIDQTGNMNSAYVTLNLWGTTTCCTRVKIAQDGDYNEVDLDISGSFNGDAMFEGYNAGIVVLQTGEDNLLVGTDGFGFTINGNKNNLFVEQVGNGNTASGYMLGNMNNAQIMQYGDNNFASITMSAY